MARERHTRNPKSPSQPSTLRIIGGRLRGSSIQYHGDRRTRPMKDRVREAAFNLIGPRIAGTHAIDLFAGTGALAFEALSRGATSALLIERHFPTARLIEQNAEALGVSDHVSVFAGDTFVWSKRQPLSSHDGATATRHVVFCSPPYDLYVTQTQDMLDLISAVAEQTGPGSILIVESDARFDTALLPDCCTWDVRNYPPAVLAIGCVDAVE
jgi:16S rRNA (guanine966-N2)-methyltransferase